MSSRKSFTLIALLAVAALVLVACGGGVTPAPAAEQPAAEEPMMDVSGDVVADGSSTVYPITTAVAEEFAFVYPNVRVSVGLSGTGGGFSKFCLGETDISDASRPIKDEEAADCEANGIEYLEFMVALDGLSVMVHPDNDFVQCLSVDQLVDIFRPDSTITTWADIDPSWPDDTILFFVPDPDSGTRDYFVEVIESAGDLPEELADIRQDENTTFSSDDNVLLDGIANNVNAIGWFGYAYYVENAGSVRLVAVENSDGECVEPNDTTVQDGTYNPLSRPLFIYANAQSLVEKPQVAEFVRFFLSSQGGPAIMADVGYSLPPAGTYEEDAAMLEEFLSQ